MSIFYKTSNQIAPERKNIFPMVIFAAMIMAGLILFNFVSLAALMPFFDYDPSAVAAFAANPLAFSNNTWPLLLLQSIISGGAFVIIPLFFLYKVEKSCLSNLNLSRSFAPVPFRLWILAVLIVLIFMPFNGIFIEWNESVKLPEAFSGIERWAMEKEKSMQLLTESLTNLKGIAQLAAGVFVIALVPAIGEELVFRGVIQNKTFHNTGNAHLSIWITAFLFSAVHLQFYGFVPRMLLGALFGYLYYWSGNITIPVMAHFFNNAFTLLMINMKNRDMISIDIESTANLPGAVVAVSVVLTVFLVGYFKFLGNNVTLQREISG